MYQYRYIDKQRFLEDFFLDLELDPKADVSVRLCLAKKGGVVAHQAESSLLFYLLEVDLFVFENDLEPVFLSADLE